MIKPIVECDNCLMQNDITMGQLMDSKLPEGWVSVNVNSVTATYCCTECMALGERDLKERVNNYVKTFGESLHHLKDKIGKITGGAGL